MLKYREGGGWIGSIVWLWVVWGEVMFSWCSVWVSILSLLVSLVDEVGFVVFELVAVEDFLLLIIGRELVRRRGV